MWTVNHPPFPFWFWPPPNVTAHWYAHQQPAWGTPTPDVSSTKGVLIALPPPLFYPPPWTAGSNTNLPPIWQCVPPPPPMNCTNKQSRFETLPAPPPPHPRHDHHRPDDDDASPPLGFANHRRVEEGYWQNEKRAKCSQPGTDHGKSWWCQEESQRPSRAHTWSQGLSGFPSTHEVDLTSSSRSSYDQSLGNRSQPKQPPPALGEAWSQIPDSQTCQVEDTATPAASGRHDTGLPKQDQLNLCALQFVAPPTPTPRPTCATRPPLATVTRPTLMVRPTIGTRPTPAPQTPATARHEPVTWPTPVPTNWPGTPGMQIDPRSWLVPQPAPNTAPSHTSWRTSVKRPIPTANTEHHPPRPTSLSGTRSIPKQTGSENFVMNFSRTGSGSYTHSVTSGKNVHERKLYSDDDTVEGKRLGCDNLSSNAIQCFDAGGLVVKQEKLDDTTLAQEDSKERLRSALPIFSHTDDDDESPKETQVKTESWEAIVKTEEPVSADEGGVWTVWKPFSEPKIKSEDTSAAEEEEPVAPANLPVDFDHGDGLLLDREFLEASIDALVPVCRIQLPLSDSTSAREGSANPPNSTVATPNTGAISLASANASTTSLAAANTSTTSLAAADTSATTLATSNIPATTQATANRPTTADNPIIIMDNADTPAPATTQATANSPTIADNPIIIMDTADTPVPATTQATANRPTTADNPIIIMDNADISAPATTQATANSPTTADNPIIIMDNADTPIPATTQATADNPIIIIDTADTLTHTPIQATTRTHTVTTSRVTWKEYKRALGSSGDDRGSVMDDSSESAATQIFEEEEPELIIDILSHTDSPDDSRNDENDAVDTDRANHQELGKETNMIVAEESDPPEGTTDYPDVNCCGVVNTITTGGPRQVGRTHKTPVESTATTEQPQSATDTSSLDLGRPSTSKERETEGGNAEFDSAVKYPTTKAPVMFVDDASGCTSKDEEEEELTKVLRTCSYLLMDGVSDTCPLGHVLDPSSATFNVCTWRITVPCTACNITIYMNVR